MAEANAQAVLDAYDDANEAVTTAQTALDNAKAAVDPDATDSDALTRALTAAIEAAEGALKSCHGAGRGVIAAQGGRRSLVKGDDPEDRGLPDDGSRSAEAEIVAMDIGEALRANERFRRESTGERLRMLPREPCRYPADATDTLPAV